jgi:hypothetical protein
MWRRSSDFLKVITLFSTSWESIFPGNPFHERNSMYKTSKNRATGGSGFLLNICPPDRFK